MTIEEARNIMLKAAEEHAAGDDSFLELVAKVVKEQDDAKHELRMRGYGWLGLGLYETACLVAPLK